MDIDIKGSLWASSEIVLGSFLHNARIPLRGHALTFVGIAILVAGHRLWPERGLLWRAGLVCAAMKSISPSAFILGPMLAISLQGFLLELGTLAVGANPLGYFLGGGLAMSWSLFHKIGKILLFYGPEAAVLYGRGWGHLQARWGLEAWGPWTPLLLLGAVNFLAGSTAAAVGLRAAKIPPRPAVLKAGREASRAAAAGGHSRLGLWPYLYRVFKRPKLWGGVLLACLLAGFLLGRSANGMGWHSGLLIGLRMGLRAMSLTLGFAAAGWWLRNSQIRLQLERGRTRMLWHTVDSAFNALPGIVAALPSGREFARRPLASLRDMLARAPQWLESLPLPRPAD